MRDLPPQMEVRVTEAEVALLVERLGVERASEVLIHRAKSVDDEVRGYIALIHQPGSDALRAAKWICRFEGEDGLGCWDLPRKGLRLIHSVAKEDDGQVWAHVSVSRRDRCMPTWEQVRDVGWLIYDQIPGVIVVAPRTEHVNLGEVAHVWFCLTRPAVPDFSHGLGTI